jgi:predicted SAM-dependent methyltransferase
MPSHLAMPSETNSRGRRLHIGGTCRTEGWEVLNALPGHAVDHVGNANDLSSFASDSFEAIYASHVLEHFDYVGEIDQVLTEWFRVLVPGGQLFISVPDLETLARLFLDKEHFDEDERFHITRMIFGGHTDAYDYHQSGISEAILVRYLERSGFQAITRVSRFDLFEDTSNLEFKGVPISLNIQASKPIAVGHEEVSVQPAADSPHRKQADGLALEETTFRPSANWDHGYFSGGSYDAGFYVEMSPHRLDFSALVNGHRSPRSQPGASFRYLELGSGMGLGLCLMAAAHPEGEFVGVDFVPDHIAYSQWLAKALDLSNIRFLEADFLNLQVDPQPLDSPAPEGGSGFHYVVAHGIATWVSAPVQQAVLDVAATQLLPGGLFYCSYNTYPGWLGRNNFHMLASLKRRFEHPVDPLKAFAEARTSLQALTGYGLPLGRSLPQLASSLEALGAEKNTAYLLGEFGPFSWAPLYVAEMHGLCQEHKLTYLATASLPELFEDLLPEPLRMVVSAEVNPTLRQALLDLAINQSFRRDIFVKGILPLRKHQREQALAQLPIIKVTESIATGNRFATSFGELMLDDNLLSVIESLLEEGPCAIGDLCIALGMTVDQLLPSLSLLINSYRIELLRGDSALSVPPAGLDVNRRLRDLMQDGHACGYLVAPVVGGAVCFTPLQALVLEAIEQNLDDEVAISCVLMSLSAIGGNLNDPSGRTIIDPQEQQEALEKYLEEFRALQLPQLRRLGVI